MTNYTSMKSEAIKYNTSSDQFSWLEGTRGLSLNMIDNEMPVLWAESLLGDLKETGKKQLAFMNKWKERCWPEQTPNQQWEYEINELERLRSLYKKQLAATIELRKSLALLEPQEEDTTSNEFESLALLKPEQAEKKASTDETAMFHWACAKKHWTHIYNYVVDNEVPRKHIQRLLQLVTKAKHKSSISSYMYFKIAYHCACELNLRTEKFRLLKYAEVCKKHAKVGSSWCPAAPKEEEPKEVSLMEGLHASMSFDMEEAVDFMARVRSVAKRQHISLEEAVEKILG